MAKKTFVLAHSLARRNAMHYIAEAPEGWVVTVSEPVKKRIQEEKYHAMIRDIARQTDYAGRQWCEDDMKRILVDEFADEMRAAGTPVHHDGRVIPSEDGCRVIQLGMETSKFYVREASAFIEFLYAWGSHRNVKWTEPILLEDAHA
jgi:hypothetical protein